MNFSPAQLLEILQRLPDTPGYWIAYSGGLDSHVLLHTMAELRPALAPRRVQAVHVNHGLSPDAGAWVRHCAAVCEGLGITCRQLTVDARPVRGEGPEAAARYARYTALAGLLAPGETLLTAHHQGDQAETVLLQLLRGAGPHGLAAMPGQAPFAAGVHARPLLAFTRDDLRTYARDRALSWVEDESNGDLSLERNYLRREIIPRLRGRWPAMGRTLARSAGHNREAAVMLDEIAAQDLQSVIVPHDGALSVARLSRLAGARLRNVLRYWLRRRGLPLPTAEQLHQIEGQLPAGNDRSPRVRWPGAEVRRYRGRLYALAPLPETPSSLVLPWDPTSPVALPGGGTLYARTRMGAGVKADLCYSEPVTVRYRNGGERCRPAGARYSRTVKNLFQELGVPPWVRARVPLVYIGERLAAVADYWVCHPFQAQPREQGMVFQWQRPAFGAADEGRERP